MIRSKFDFCAGELLMLKMFNGKYNLLMEHLDGKILLHNGLAWIFGIICEYLWTTVNLKHSFDEITV